MEAIQILRQDAIAELRTLERDHKALVDATERTFLLSQEITNGIVQVRERIHYQLNTTARCTDICLPWAIVTD
jgi:hypothetical protein